LKEWWSRMLQPEIDILVYKGPVLRCLKAFSKKKWMPSVFRNALRQRRLYNKIMAVEIAKGFERVVSWVFKTLQQDRWARFMASHEYERPPLTPRTQAFIDADVDNDGVISLEEFAHAIHAPNSIAPELPCGMDTSQPTTGNGGSQKKKEWKKLANAHKAKQLWLHPEIRAQVAAGSAPQMHPESDSWYLRAVRAHQNQESKGIGLVNCTDGQDEDGQGSHDITGQNTATKAQQPGVVDTEQQDVQHQAAEALYSDMFVNASAALSFLDDLYERNQTHIQGMVETKRATQRLIRGMMKKSRSLVEEGMLEIGEYEVIEHHLVNYTHFVHNRFSFSLRDALCNNDKDDLIVNERDFEANNEKAHVSPVKPSEIVQQRKGKEARRQTSASKAAAKVHPQGSPDHEALPHAAEPEASSVVSPVEASSVVSPILPPLQLEALDS